MDPESHAFGRAYRLADADAYGAVFERGRSARSRWFKGRAAENNLDHPRLGLAISRRAARRAVDRNRLKRIIREFFRTHREQLPPLDYVVLANDGAARRSRGELERSLDDLFDGLSSNATPAQHRH